MSTAYDKQMAALRYFLLGAKMYQGVDALEYGRSIHVNFRKDGSPEYSHQIHITSYIRTLLDNLTHPEATIVAALLHDAMEDYKIPRSIFEAKYSTLAVNSIELLDKSGKTTQEYYDRLSACPISSIVKGADRIHNLLTMPNAFSHDKQASYIKETQEYTIPMLKVARKRFPMQEQSYENIKHTLQVEIALIEGMLNEAKNTKPETKEQSIVLNLAKQAE